MMRRIRLWLAQVLAPRGCYVLDDNGIRIVGRRIVGLTSDGDTLYVYTEADDFEKGGG